MDRGDAVIGSCVASVRINERTWIMDNSILSIFRQLSDDKQKQIIAFSKMLSSYCEQEISVQALIENKEKEIPVLDPKY